MENGHAENASWPTLAPLNKTIDDANYNRHVGNGSKIGQGENESAFECTSEGIWLICEVSVNGRQGLQGIGIP